MANLEFHPLAEIFPLIDGAEQADLAADIRTYGLREPIIKYEGKILDGRNRYLACVETGTEPRFEAYTGDNPVAFVISLNLKRRHLNESQRAMVAAKLATLTHGGDRVSKQAENLPLAQARAAELLNVSDRSLRSAKSIQSRGAPELVAAVQSGKVSVSAAAEVASRPVEQQREIVALSEDNIVKAANKIKLQRKKEKQKKKETERRAIPANIPKIGECYRLIHADIRTAEIQASSIDCIVTDPPYPQEFIEVFGWLAECGSRWLKPGGSMLVMSGQSWLPEVLAQLTAHGLTYQWTLAYLTPGGQAVQVFPRRVNTFWKPVFWFVKGAYGGDWIGDVAKSDVNDNDKRFHSWGQSESGMADLIERVSRPGQTIMDPFCGGGATGAVALRLNRMFVGIDSNEDAIKITADRLRKMGDAELVA